MNCHRWHSHSFFTYRLHDLNSASLRYQTAKLATMKRSATSPDDSRKQNKKSRSKKPEPDYCDVACSVDSGGSAIWPASSDAMETARDFLKRWSVQCIVLGHF